MLVSIYLGQDIRSAKLHGELYFAQLPQPGEKLMLDGNHLTVSKAWHTPDTHFAGSKYAILADGYHASPEVAGPINRGDRQIAEGSIA